ncbi:MAG: DUF2793 domain-containing protein [Rhizobiaceae bacterium]|jgi:hypothetical protein
MDSTANLALPYILPAQAQKHVTHNEALRALDALVQLSVADRHLATPPATPAEGDRYIVAAGAGDAWSGQAGTIAAFQDGAWAFLPPKKGWIAWVADENKALALRRDLDRHLDEHRQPHAACRRQRHRRRDEQALGQIRRGADQP